MSALHRIPAIVRAAWKVRLRADAAGPSYWGWLVLSLLLVLFVPSQLLNDVPFWRLSHAGTGQALLAVSAFLSLSLVVGVSARRARGMRLIAAVPVAVVCYGAAYWFLRMRPGLVHGWSDFAVAAALGAALVLLPYLPFRAVRRLTAATLSMALVFVVLIGTKEAIGLPERTTITSALEPLSVTMYRSLVPPQTGRGGAVERYGDGFLLVTSDGTFYTLRWNGDSLISEKHPLSLPPEDDNVPLPADRAYVPAAARRVTDLLLDTTVSPANVYVAYQRWDAARRCMAVRIARSLLDEPHGGAAGWQTLFETSPCLTAFTGFDWVEAGGRLAKIGDDLLVTVGEFGLTEAGRPGAQSRENSFGKVWLVDPEGHAQIYTMGHRNPQGLFVDADGRVWLTEHGPQGGDELNLLEPGRNYGYPLVTYGTTYGSYSWAAAPQTHDHGSFEEPVQAFPPWKGLSNLIRVESNLFSSWRGDLLVGTLNSGNLFRVRLRGARAVYMEPLSLGVRVRDLVEGADGRLIVWTDTGALLAIARGSAAPDGAAVFGRCRQCHDAPTDQSATMSLKGIVGRRVAGVGGYPYSEALRRLGGVWTEDRLDAFLADPDSYAPGSLMSVGRVAEEAERKALLQFLRNHR